MYLGEKIAYFRNMRGLTQEYLGMRVGFPKRNADVRIAQYECAARFPKSDMIRKMAMVFKIVPDALTLPDSENHMQIMQILFDWEDAFNLHVEEIDGKLCLCLGEESNPKADVMAFLLNDWYQQRQKLLSGKMSREEYNDWRYAYPMYDPDYHYFHQPYLDKWFDTVEALLKEDPKVKKPKARVKAKKEIHDNSESFVQEYIATQQEYGFVPEESTSSDSPATKEEETPKKPKRYKVIRGFKK
ncbi:MAG: helix-turn-helix transcriptional regulator [Clostridia bacterium]|nr:helix-turn-helix transcriptional regulator [Clostridia bacterium]